MIIIQGSYEQAINYLNSSGESYFEFVLPYVKQDNPFKEIDRFLWESKHILRFKNEYIGNTAIELSAWNDLEPCEFNEYFDAFMYFLRSKHDKLQPLFIIRGKCSSVLFEKLSKHFELHVYDPDKGEIPFSDKKVAIGFRS